MKYKSRDYQYGNFLAEKREQTGLSQPQLAVKAGLNSGTTISKWECGVSYPNARSIKKLAAVFGCTADELLEPLN